MKDKVKHRKVKVAKRCNSRLASARSHHSVVGVYLVLGLTVMAHLEKSLGIQHQINPLMNGTRLQTKQKGKGPAPLQGHDCCPALRSNAATLTRFVIVVHGNLQFCTSGDRTQHACCVTTQRCILQYSDSSRMAQMSECH